MFLALVEMHMAYLPRKDLLFDGATFHITWQCYNFSWFLKDDDIKRFYYDLLLHYRDKYGILIYSYTIMDNHIHFTGQTPTIEKLSAFMKAVNSSFAKKINKILKKRGQVVMDRFKSPIIQSDEILLRVMTYGDLNASRAGKVKDPKGYKWSSYRHYAYGEEDPLITPAPSYLALGNTDTDRQSSYRDMVEDILKEDMEQREYSTTYYIGNPDWVQERYEELKHIRIAKREAYLKRQYKILHTNAPP